jgi:hypothetical protein
MAKQIGRRARGDRDRAGTDRDVWGLDANHIMWPMSLWDADLEGLAGQQPYDRFHGIGRLGLVGGGGSILAVRSWFIWAWSAYDSNHGSGQLVQQNGPCCALLLLMLEALIRTSFSPSA